MAFSFKNIRAGRKAHSYIYNHPRLPECFFWHLRRHRFAKAFGIQYENGATFRESILEGEKRVKHCLGNKVLKELRIKDHCHHIGFDFKPDNRLYCFGCHGDMLHSKVKKIRAFANMHASYIACHTYHVKLEGSEKAGVFLNGM